MRSRRISKRGLASPGGTESSPSCSKCPLQGGERAVASDGYEDSGLSTRAIAANITQITRMPSHGVVSIFSSEFYNDEKLPPLVQSKTEFPPSPIMLPHRGGGGGPVWNGRCTSGVFSPGRVIQGVKAIPLYPAKA
ncbi:hypothetical protein AVEN_42645-1 [Araneus ventricosus]|uniref:Uncharacterized protein n=1 Tax=Araneus ventricosus TaxID=182803 RepID=A0A4Y2BLQ6_ARAVE|nr:hypothetical protein AVEN_42645-1 [Araneus ventricosus]